MFVPQNRVCWDVCDLVCSLYNLVVMSGIAFFVTGTDSPGVGCGLWGCRCMDGVSV